MVVNDGYRVFVGDVVTGAILADLPVSSQKWGLRLNDAGSVSASVPTWSTEAEALDLQTLTAPVRTFLGVAYGPNVLEAGPIWKRSYNAESGVLDLDAAGIWTIFDRRKAVPGSALVPGARVTSATISIRNKSLGSVGRELVRIAIEDNPYGGSLPISLPPVVDGPHNLEYPGYELGWIGERLRQLTGLDGGPDIRFQPRYKDGDPTRLEWVFQTGSEADPILHQPGADWVWDVSVPESGVTGLSVDEDASDLAAKAWVPGSGQDKSMLLASALDTTLVDAGYPWTEVDTASKSIEDLSLLQKYADRLEVDSSRPWETWSLNVRADVDPVLGAYLPGDLATVYTSPHHPIIRNAQHRVRLLALDGDGSASVKLGIAPMKAEQDADLGVSITTSKTPATLLYPGSTTFPGPDTYPLGATNDTTQLE